MPTIWYKRADGALTEAFSEPDPPEVPAGAAVLTKAQYDGVLAQILEARTKAQDAALAEETAAKEADSAALVKLGLPKAAADRILGLGKGRKG